MPGCAANQKNPQPAAAKPLPHTCVVASNPVVCVALHWVEVEHHHQVTTLNHNHLVTLVLQDSTAQHSAAVNDFSWLRV